jgi:molybdenum cofactor cytidylyltransferase
MLELAMIVTAAGLSSRFPPNKLLEIVENKSCIEHTVSTFTDFNLDVYVVLGYQDDQIRKVLEDRYGDQLIFAHNSQYETGLASSVITGVKAAGATYDYWGFCPGDKPFIQHQTVDLLIQKLYDEKPLILAPQFNKLPGHPTFFSRELAPKFINITGDSGGRQIIKAFPKETLTVNVKDEGVTLDMDRYLESKHV